MGYSPWHRKELGTTEQLTFLHFVFKAIDAVLQNNPALGT